MNNSESGRKINQAVNTTSKAVGGALSQAKGAFSNWWSSMTTPPIIPNVPPKFPNPNDVEIAAAEVATNDETVDSDDDANKNGNDTIPSSDDRNRINHAATPVKKATDVRGGIVEIGKEADFLDSGNAKSKVIDV